LGYRRGEKGVSRCRGTIQRREKIILLWFEDANEVMVAVVHFCPAAVDLA
jgi:hypothetical protein